MLKRLISTQDRTYYTHMHEIIRAIDGVDNKLKWLISSVEAYPHTVKYEKIFNENEYIIISSKALLELLSEDDFQWIWAVFSGFNESTSDDDILKYAVPSVESECIYQDNTAIIQHPLAQIEIVVEDSSSCFIVTEHEDVLQSFNKLFQKAKNNY